MNSKPFKILGSTLKKMRETKRLSVAEVSGAVEIDANTLELYETGSQRPSEDILMLIISHLDLKDDEATKLWELAGYNSDNKHSDQTFELGQQVAMVMPMDARVVYTDMVHVMVNDYGVVMNFMQGAGPGNQPLAVARVGMSKEHAMSVIDVLQRSLNQPSAAPKMIPSSTKDNHQEKQQSE